MSKVQFESEILLMYSKGFSINYIVDSIMPLMFFKKSDKKMCQEHVLSVIVNSRLLKYCV